MNMKSILLFAAILLSAMAAAQDSPGTRVKVSGKACAAETREALPFATIIVSYVADGDTIPYRQLCDKDGTFAISLPYASEYMLTADFIGMAQYRATLRAKPGDTAVDAGTILMEEGAIALKEATVTARKVLVKAGIDRLSYEMKDDPMSKNDNLLNALRKVPLVTVDGQGNIQIKGSGNFKVFMDGKPSNLFAQNTKEVMRAIPAKSIKRIEVITDPGVKYDAEGVSAILNIVTDTGSGLEGYTGSVGLSADSNPIISPNIYLSAKKGKFGITANLSAYAGRTRQMTAETEYRSGDRVTTQRSETDANRLRGLFGNILLSYEIDSLNLINVNASLQNYSSDYSSRTDEQTGSDSFGLRSRTKYAAGGDEISVDYQRSTSRPGELFTLSYHYSYTPDVRDVLSTRTRGLSSSIHPSTLYIRRDKVNGSQHEHTGQIDYTTPIGLNHVIEAGTKYIVRSSGSDPEYLHKYSEDEAWRVGSIGPLYGLSDGKFEHTYNIGAAYIAYQYRTMKYSLKAGARFEGGWLSAKFAEKPEADFSKKFFEWVPQVNFSYNFAPTTQAKASYNFRIRRPGIAHLNPFRMQTDEHTAQVGNPNLEAARLHSFELGYSTYGQRLSLNMSVGYEFTDNAIERYTRREGDVLLNTYGNIATNRAIALHTYAMYSPTLWLRAYTNIRLDHTWYESRALELKEKALGGSLIAGMLFTLPHDWGIDLNGGYFIGSKGLQTKMSDTYFTRLGVNKQLMQKKLSISAGVNNVFEPYFIFRNETKGRDFSQVTNTRFVWRSFTIGISYSFGEMKSRISRTQRTIRNDDLSPVQGQSGAGVPAPGK